ncbi:putative ABC transporter permease protein [Actinoplanes missouriensis 431]|uniref:Putative ABC transporter permease protein n=1 Tax=Actinoplanes missouriensis (strain ATCC 14538 / DSM 43046 / CBS 188.64 / JCM 3121 / NBRC 102363 / NCIMB 12654 / NRRL B-3342 / UNCC 431) TaxID=512565 RepID=I0HAA5_ACTM4|nr:ABC transporter permease [Actinoplanes missouriensis]BAL89942.1 putative ABC transporter permease protein [Actinoplanes missouriensis 431]
MTRYLLRRTAILIGSLFAAAVVLFVLLRLLPGDPANALLPVGATPEQIAAAQRELGTDAPLLSQFLTWLGNVFTLDLGNSLISTLPVGDEILARLPVTIPLTLAAFVLAVLIAVPVGALAAARADRWYGPVINAVAQLGIAVPAFWVGLLLITVFALQLGVLPAGGFPPDGWADPAAAIEALVLPVVTVALVMSASLIRYVRSATLDVLGADYLRTARALGATPAQAMWRHGLRNAAVPVIAVLAMELATTFLGAVVVESVFALPGLGSMLVRGISQHDYPVIQGVMLVSTATVLLVGFLGDLAQRLVDPRLLHRAAS